MQTGATVLVSPDVSGVPRGRDNIEASISGGGGKVAYLSGGFAHVRDLANGTTRLASDPGFFADSVQISQDGRWAALVDDDGEGGFAANVVDTVTGAVRFLAQVCGTCAFVTPIASISGTGRFVAFESRDRLVPSDTDGEWDVYLRDRDTDGNGVFDEAGKTSTTLVGIRPQGDSPFARFPAISEDGRTVAFDAVDLAYRLNYVNNIYARDIPSGTTTLVSQNSLGVPATMRYSGRLLSVSSDGRLVAFSTIDPHMAVDDTSPRCYGHDCMTM